MRAGRLVPAAVAPLAVGYIALAWSRAGLLFDGSQYFVTSIHLQQGVTQHGRFSATPLQLPAVAASHWTDATDALAVVFSATYLAVPLVAFALSWFVLGARNRELLVWWSLGMVVILPGAPFVISEAVLASYLVWPFVFATVAPATPRRFGVAVVLLPVLWGLHPVSAVFFAVTGVAAAATAVSAITGHGLRASPLPRRLLFSWPVVLFVAATTRVALMLSDRYESGQATFEAVREALQAEGRVGLAPAVGAGLVGAALLLHRRSRAQPALVAVIGAGVVVAVVSLVARAVSQDRWATADQYRLLVGLVTVPFLTGAVVDARRRRTDRDLGNRLLTGHVLAVSTVAAVVLAVISLQWRTATGDLDRFRAASATPCVEVGGLARDHLSLSHWAIGHLSIAVGGRRPSALVAPVLLPCTGIVFSDATGAIRLPFSRPLAPGGWFDLAVLTAAS